MAQHIKVVPYDSAWPSLFAVEKKAIEKILKDNSLAIYHIGSTAVPGLSAKPIIDIMVAVRSLEMVDAVQENFTSIGYEYLGEFGIKGRRYLRKGGDERTHQIHIFKGDDTHNIVRHLALRDYLREHPQECAQYASLKADLAQKYPFSIEDYCDGKESFVKALESRALSFYDSSWDLLYLKARQVQNPRQISSLIEAGGVSCALLSGKSKIYCGVCIDTACSLGMCAERNAIANLITQGESEILKLLVIMPDLSLGMPCGACRELMMQLGKSALDIENLCNYEEKKSIKLQTLLPNWWQ